MIIFAIFLTIIYILLNILIWEKTHSIPILLIQILFYAYTFHGYLVVILGKYFLPSLYNRFSYVFEYPYYVSVNNNFVLSYTLYCVFSVVYLSVLYVMVSSAAKQKSKQLQYPILNLWALVCVGALCLVIGSLFWYKALINVLKTGKSAYIIFKRDEIGLGAWYPVSRLIFDLGAMSLLFSIIVFFKINNRIKIKSSYFKPIQAIVIVTLNVLLFSVLMAFGDKTALFNGLLFAICIASVNNIVSGKKLVYLFVVLSVFIIIINTITITRHNPVGLNMFFILEWSVLSLLAHAEVFSTFSQYAMLNNNVDSYGGKAVVSVVYSLIPRVLAEPFHLERPEDSYTYFANAAGMADGTGWGIHNASDWYMNFGFIGIIIGAIVLGTFHGYLYRKKSKAWHFAFYGCVAAFPLFIRSGMLEFKGTIYNMILAWLVYNIGFRRFHLKSKPLSSKTKYQLISR